jgi:hypothetical protein
VKALLLAMLLLAEPAEPATAREAAAVPFSCPAGTERQGTEPPDGFEAWCEKPGEPPERRREGPSRTWYDDGVLAKEAGFKEGRPHGKFNEWHRNGKPASAGAHENGARAGTWTIWFEGGRKAEELSYAAGERHGAFATWWPNGKRRVEGRYCHGLQCGAWTSWDEDGRELGRVKYEEIRRTP